MTNEAKNAQAPELAKAILDAIAAYGPMFRVDGPTSINAVDPAELAAVIHHSINISTK